MATIAVPISEAAESEVRRGRFRRAFGVLLVVQGFHALEHATQLIQRYVLHERAPHGLLGMWVNFEWMHLAFNLTVGAALLALFLAFELHRATRRGVGWWAFALAIVVEDGLHVPEHVVRIVQYLRFGWNPAPGILGHVGGVGAGPFDLVVLHSTYNLVVTGLLVVVFLTPGFPDLEEPEDPPPPAGPATRLVPAGIGGGLALLLIAAACQGPARSPGPSPTPLQTLAGTAPCIPGSPTLAVAAKDIRYSTGLVGCLAMTEDTAFTVVFANQDPGVEHNIGIFAGPRMYSINSPTLFRGRAFPGVRTVEYHAPGLPPGMWTFHCDLHPDQMFGTFVVPLRVTDQGFDPVHARMTQGNAMVWQISSKSGASHSVTDAGGVFGGPGGLMDSGMKRPGETFTFKFLSAGTYAAVDGATGHRAWISVPVRIRPTPGAPGIYDVIWSLMDAQPGFAFDVQIERPGAAGFANFEVGRRSASAGFMPDAGPGTYLFRPRLRSVATGKASAWSPTTSLTTR